MTEKERKLIDTARELGPEELDFMIQLMQFIDKQEPARREKIASWTEETADKYRLRTAAGRAAFWADMMAV